MTHDQLVGKLMWRLAVMRDLQREVRFTEGGVPTARQREFEEAVDDIVTEYFKPDTEELILRTDLGLPELPELPELPPIPPPATPGYVHDGAWFELPPLPLPPKKDTP